MTLEGCFNQYLWSCSPSKLYHQWVGTHKSFGLSHAVDQPPLGEQSVGKSFALNHLMDTSFAGSAMRTTGTYFTPRLISEVDPTSRRRMDVDYTYG